MQINEVIWRSQFIEKIASKHGVKTTEVEEVFSNRPHFRFASKGKRPGENVYSAKGQTDAGRYLIVFFILKPHHQALVISARDMDNKERRYYGRKK